MSIFACNCRAKFCGFWSIVKKYMPPIRIFLLSGCPVHLYCCSQFQSFFCATKYAPSKIWRKRQKNLGLGSKLPDFKPVGASEVRRAASAFMKMRDRIQAHIEQRTTMLAGVSHDLRTPLTLSNYNWQCCRAQMKCRIWKMILSKWKICSMIIYHSPKVIRENAFPNQLKEFSRGHCLWCQAEKTKCANLSCRAR